MLAVLGAGALPATAAEPSPTPPGFTPPPLPDPSDPAYRGPTYVITPGVGGSELPSPSDPRDIEQAKKEDRSHQHAGTGKADKPATSGKPGPGKPARASTETAGPQTPLVTAASREKVAPALRGFAALVAMVVLFEITAVRRLVFRRRRASVTAG